MIKHLLTIGLLMACGYTLSAQNFHPTKILTLNEMMELAQHNRPELKAASLKVASAREGKSRTRNQKLPSLALNADNRINTQLQSNLLPGLIFGQPGQDRLVAFGATYFHLIGFEAGISIFKPQQKVEERIQAAKLLDAEKLLEQKRTAVFYEVVEAALNQRLLLTQIELIKSKLAYTNLLKAEVENALGEGKKRMVDLEKVKLELMQQTYALKDLERQVNLASTRLNYALGVEPQSSAVTIKDDFLNHVPQLPSGTSSLATNLDLQLAELKVRTQEMQTELVKKRYLPQLSGYGFIANQYLSKEFDVLNFSSPWLPFSYLGFKLNWTIFDKMDRKHAYNQAKLETQIQALEKNTLLNQLSLREQELLADYQNKYETLQLMESQLALSKRIAAADKSSLEEGKITKAEFENSQNGLKEAEFSFFQAKIAIWQAWHRLNQHRGVQPR